MLAGFKFIYYVSLGLKLCITATIALLAFGVVPQVNEVSRQSLGKLYVRAGTLVSLSVPAISCRPICTKSTLCTKR